MDKVTDFLTNAPGLTKNPLGIIALFISLIYAIAALVLTFSNNVLTIHQNWALVLFIVLFPMIILIGFIYLVVNHHQKLYSPSDYKDETNFFRPLNSTEQSERNEEKVQDILQVDNDEENKVGNKEQEEKPSVEEEDQIKAVSNNVANGGNLKTSVPKDMQKAAQNFVSSLSNFYFLIEETVLRNLELEMKLNIRRQMALDLKKETVKFAGIAFKQAEIIAVEVKYTRSGRIEQRTIQNLIRLIQIVSNNYQDNRSFKFIFVFVSDKPFVNHNQARQAICDMHKDVVLDIRFYRVEDLKNNKAEEVAAALKH